MPQCCAVPMCSSRKPGHRFPRDLEIRKKWLVAMMKENYVVTKNSCVCKRHFLPTDYILPRYRDVVFVKQRLRKDAVPSQFDWPKGTTLYELSHLCSMKSKESRRSKLEANYSMEAARISQETEMCLAQREWERRMNLISDPLDHTAKGYSNSIQNRPRLPNKMYPTPMFSLPKLIGNVVPSLRLPKTLQEYKAMWKLSSANRKNNTTMAQTKFKRQTFKKLTFVPQKTPFKKSIVNYNKYVTKVFDSINDSQTDADVSKAHYMANLNLTSDVKSRSLCGKDIVNNNKDGGLSNSDVNDGLYPVKAKFKIVPITNVVGKPSRPNENEVNKSLVPFRPIPEPTSRSLKRSLMKSLFLKKKDENPEKMELELNTDEWISKESNKKSPTEPLVRVDITVKAEPDVTNEEDSHFECNNDQKKPNTQPYDVDDKAQIRLVENSQRDVNDSQPSISDNKDEDISKNSDLKCVDRFDGIKIKSLVKTETNWEFYVEITPESYERFDDGNQESNPY